MKKYYLIILVLVASLSGSIAQPQSPFCDTLVQHLGIPAEITSAVFVTIENTSPSTMVITVRSNTADSVDDIIIPGGSGGVPSPIDYSVPGSPSRTLTWPGVTPDSVQLNVLWSKANFGGNWQLSPNDFLVDFDAICAGGPVLTQPVLPITFDDTTVNYDLVDFGGNASSIVMDPMGGPNMVGRAVKTSGAQVWAGTTMGNSGLGSAIPFTANASKMRVRVYAPAAGIPIRLKVEDAANPAISVETEDTTTVANAWETLEFDFTNEAPSTPALNLANTYDKASIFFFFGTDGAGVGADSIYFWDDVEFVPGPPVLTQVDLPITFDDTTVNYDLVDFGGNASSIVMDPMGGPNMVGRAVKTPGAQVWAGTTMGNTGLANAIPFNAFSTKMRVRVYAPAAGIPIRLKVEDAANPAISVETEDTTTVANGWETLEFDFTNEAPSTPALNLANTYDKASIFFFFGTDGAGVGADSVYFWDDVEFVPGVPPLSQVDLPITFDDSTVNYDLVDFGGNASGIVMDPTGGPNMVGRAVKTPGAQVWAGTTMGNSGLANAIPFSAGSAVMRVRVYAPAAGIPIRLKVEDAANPAISVETEDTTTVANGWETLEFDFTNEAPSTPALNLANTYDKASIFFFFGTDGAGVGADSVYFWDDVEYVAPILNQIDLPVTFEDSATDYTLTDFAGTYTFLEPDPITGASNTVAKTTKSFGSLTFAGTTMGPPSGTGFANPIPFSANATKMRARVYSPAVGVPVRMKVEDAANPALSVETEVLTTVANAWDTLEFDFVNNVPGTPGINLNNNYDRAIIFFQFGLDGASIGADSVFYWDDVEFVPPTGPVLNQIDLPVTFEDTAVDYSLTDFAGNASILTTDPTGGTNTVVLSIKTGGALTFAGTTIGNPVGTGFANPIPFTGSDTRMSVRVYAPAAGIPVRMKVEDSNNGAISVETEVLTAVANAWDTLVFDFSTQVTGTPVLDTNNTYDKATIFFHFGSDGASIAPDSAYYWDDVEFLGGGGITLSQIDLPVTFEDTTVNYSLTDFGGNVTTIGADPVNASNTVAISEKTSGSQTFAGTTIGTPSGFANEIPFTADSTLMSVAVYSPIAGIPVRLKVEDAANPAIFVEVDVFTAVANTWDTLVFDFANPVPGSPALDTVNVYDKATIFFNFGAVGSGNLYYWDNVFFGGVLGPQLSQIDLPVTFEDTTVNYTVIDFAGNVTVLEADPTGATNTVAKTTKTSGSQSFAGTTMGTAQGFANPVPFTASATKMKVRVYAPAIGIPVRLKVEDAADPAISVETEAVTAIANAWDTLEFDFSNEAAGTPALNVANTYDKATIFFFFGTDGAGIGGDSVYYWDDCMFGGLTIGFEELATSNFNVYPNPARDVVTISSKLDIQEIRVINTIGAEVMRREVQNTEYNLDIQSLKPGTYVLQMITEDGAMTSRLVKD